MLYLTTSASLCTVKWTISCCECRGQLLCVYMICSVWWVDAEHHCRSAMAEHVHTLCFVAQWLELPLALLDEEVFACVLWCSSLKQQTCWHHSNGTATLLPRTYTLCCLFCCYWCDCYLVVFTCWQYNTCTCSLTSVWYIIACLNYQTTTKFPELEEVL